MERNKTSETPNTGKVSRRACLQLGTVAGLTTVAAFTSGCDRLLSQVAPLTGEGSGLRVPSGRQDSAGGRKQIAGKREYPIPNVAYPLLNRAAFGPAGRDVARLAELGLAAYLEEQFNPPDGDSGEPWPLQLRLRNIEVLSGDPYDLNDLGDEEINRQLQQAAILRAVYSPFPLRERLVDFWSNHFNLYSRKRINTNDLSPVFVQSLLARDQANVLRKHALGSFPAMLKASARSPAMLTYLDNQKNVRGTANENYAREIMELHTLGVDGGYTQKDVQEVARCFTGWTMEEGFLKNKGTFRFAFDQHDNAEKVVLGHRIPAGGGESDGDTVLDILAKHPSTARFLSKKLVRYFYGEEHPGLIASTAKVYTKTDGDIKAMVRHLLTAEEMATAPPILKRPFDFVVSALRATNAETDGSSGVQKYLADMGQALYQWPMPDGYPDKTQAWTGSLLARWNFAFALMEDQIEGTSVRREDNANPDDVIVQVTGKKLEANDPLHIALRPHFDKPAELAALLIASPAFQWR